MKAKVKETGEIVQVEKAYDSSRNVYVFRDLLRVGRCWDEHELEFMKDDGGKGLNGPLKDFLQQFQDLLEEEKQGKWQDFMRSVRDRKLRTAEAAYAAETIWNEGGKQEQIKELNSGDAYKLGVADGISWLQEVKDFGTDWDERRYELAKAAMQGVLNAISVERFTIRIKPSVVADAAIEYADALIEKLKGGE